MAARLHPDRVQAARQSLQHLVSAAPWSDEAVLAAVVRQVLPAMTRKQPVVAWIVDDTGIPKKGKHSVGVARQYCRQLGKQDNCQVAVTLSLATWEASLPVAWRLYLPREWAEDRARRRRAGVPEEIEFQTKPEIAMDQIARALDSGLPCGAVLADAGYGSDTRFRERLAEMGLQYGVGAEGSARELVIEMGQGALRRVAWREGSNRKLQSRFVAVRVRPAHRDYWRAEPHEELWLLAEWPRGSAEPTKYWLADLPPETTLEELVRLAKHRWIVERDYLELKQELSTGNFWRALLCGAAGPARIFSAEAPRAGVAGEDLESSRVLGHYAARCIAACGVLLAERSLILSARPCRLELAGAELPVDYRPRDSPGASAAA
jgi:SRSO17 transposase